MDTLMQMSNEMSFGLPILFLFITFGLWFVYGRDEKVVGTEETFPPKGYNSAEMGFFYKGKADTQDVASLLIYLAVRGYVKITETFEKSLFATVKGFAITKLKDYEGNNPNERLFLKGLFKSKTISSFKDAMSYAKNPLAMLEDDSSKEEEKITIDNLKNSFYLTLNVLITNMNKKENKQKMYEKNSLNKRWIVALMAIASFLLITAQPVIEYHEDPYMLFILLFPASGFLILFLAICTDSFKTLTVNGVPKTKPYYSIVFGLFFGLFFGGIPFAALVLPALLLKINYLITFLIGMTCIVLMLLLNLNMTKRSRFGNELLKQIKGLKQFIETAQQHKLEQLERQYPNYFYNILPYAYVLGLSKVWFKKFEDIGLKQPDWYEGGDDFNLTFFGKFLDDAMQSTATAMATSPHKSDSSFD